MRVLALCAAAVFAESVDEDHMSVLQQRLATESEMLDRASHSGSVSARLDAAVAGKNNKCTKTEAAELVSCLRVGDVNALDVLTGGETLDGALDRIDPGALTCKTLRSDLRCLQNNPCYKWRVKHLPLEIDGQSTKQVCAAYGAEPLWNGTTATFGDICKEKVSGLCQYLYDNVAEVKSDYDRCSVTCTGAVKAEEKTVYAETMTYVKSATSDGTCTTPIESKADCQEAAKDLEGKKRKFRALRWQKRPAGCYYYKGSVWWNAVKQGSGPLKYRYPVCAEVAPAETTAAATAAATTEATTAAATTEQATAAVTTEQATAAVTTPAATTAAATTAAATTAAAGTAVPEGDGKKDAAGA